MRKFMLVIKRIFDVLASAMGLIISSPLLLIIAIIIKLTSSGPVIFKQKRLGKNGKEFDIYKFRTMVAGAEHIGDGLSIKSSSDERITKIGKFLRKTSLDELPQLGNVLIGNMSLVGPRPPVIYFPYKGYEAYSADAKMRFTMKPGITGLSQVKVRNSVPWNERILVDIEYVKEFSLLLDLKVLLLTIKRVFMTEDIYLDEK